MAVCVPDRPNGSVVPIIHFMRTLAEDAHGTLLVEYAVLLALLALALVTLVQGFVSFTTGSLESARQGMHLPG